MFINMTLDLNKLKLLAAASLALGATVFAPVAMAEEGAAPATDLVVNEASSLDELLENVKERRVVESRENTARELRFANEKAEQARLLKEAEAERLREQRRSDRLEMPPAISLGSPVPNNDMVSNTSIMPVTVPNRPSNGATTEMILIQLMPLLKRGISFEMASPKCSSNVSVSTPLFA